MYVHFDDLDETEGAWVDDADEWQWVATPPTGVPAPLPVAGAWRPGLMPGPIEKIYLARTSDQPPPANIPPGASWLPPTMLLVKWKDLSHVHCQWVAQAVLELDVGNKQRVQRWFKAKAAEAADGGGLAQTWEIEGDGDGGARDDDEPYNPDFEVVERVIGVMPQEEQPPKYLVKWRGLPYASATWESCRTLLTYQSAIRRFIHFEQLPPANERRIAAQKTRPPKTSFKRIPTTPVYKAGHTLRPYQLEGLNWLLFSWYNRRSVMLADEMGLGKTVQSVTTLNHIWQVEGIRGPFLVLAPLSTLGHWQREFDGWTEMNAITYHGSNESRELIREFEFSFTDPSASGLNKFHALITSYEVIKQDLAVFKRIPWRYMVIDEAHRLKNKDSALANDLRQLNVEHMHLLSGTPLQNNTTELWALLFFLDPSLFPSLDGFLAEFGTLESATQVDALNERIRPYLLRRQKGDVEKSLSALEETIIWVEMTLQQKKTYRAVLEGNRELLTAGATNAAMPSLVNLQMELRKACNHPFLIKGVEESLLAGPLADQTPLDQLLKASGKMVLLDKLLPKLKSEGHRVLLFSQMVRMLDVLSDYLRERRYSHERLDGTIRGDLRQAAIDRFCKPGSDTFAFLLSTRAGGLGINLIAADTCIIFDSDWNPQNDVQAMARSHRIGQTKTVKVFRLVTRNTYESEMIERANKKLGLERAMNADRGSDGLPGASGGSKGDNKGPPQDRTEVDAMLKRGAHDIFMNDDDDSAAKKFSEADIEEILQSSSTKVSYEQDTGANGSVFSKAAFVADDSRIDMDDPEFWTKILPEMQETNAELAEYYMQKRQRKEVKKFGMADAGEVDEYLDETRRRPRDPNNPGGHGEPRYRRPVLAPHEWSKTERANCERALLSFGFGRWGRIKREAGGATTLRTDEELHRFGLAFVCLCCGVPIGSVGQTAGQVEAEVEGIAKARDVLQAFGSPLPQLSKSQVEALEPIVRSDGANYSERVHKLGATFLFRLIMLKRLHEAVEREAVPLKTFAAPSVPGGVGREAGVPWSPSDDAMLLLGVYKHGYRAYVKIRDDPELSFGCRSDGPPVPAQLAPCAPPLPGSKEEREASSSYAGIVAAASGGSVSSSAAFSSAPPPGGYGFDALDVLPVPPAWGAAKPTKQQQQRAHALPLHDATFPSEGKFKARMNALLEALSEVERRRSARLELELLWEEELQRELREGGGARRPGKRARSAAADAKHADSPAAERLSFSEQAEQLLAWSTGGAHEDDASFL